MLWTVKPTTLDRYLAKIDPPDEDGHRLWTAAQDGSGYGIFRADGQLFRAHRWGYMTLVGPIPKGLCVFHACDEPGCQSPEHWVLRTRADGNRDRMRRGLIRTPPSGGALNSQAKLSEALVAEIRHRYSALGMTQKALASEYGVTSAAIGLIVTGKRWPITESGLRTSSAHGPSIPAPALWPASPAPR